MSPVHIESWTHMRVSHVNPAARAFPDDTIFPDWPDSQSRHTYTSINKHMRVRHGNHSGRAFSNICCASQNPSLPHTHIKSRTHIRASHVCRHTPMMTVPSAAESQNLSDVTHTHRVTKTYTSESFMQTFKYDGDSSICR